jgi:hypothetical protein
VGLLRYIEVVTIGNIIGGGVMTARTYWFLFGVAKTWGLDPQTAKNTDYCLLRFADVGRIVRKVRCAGSCCRSKSPASDSVALFRYPPVKMLVGCVGIRFGLVKGRGRLEMLNSALRKKILGDPRIAKTRTFCTHSSAGRRHPPPQGQIRQVTAR